MEPQHHRQSDQTGRASGSFSGVQERGVLLWIGTLVGGCIDAMYYAAHQTVPGDNGLQGETH